MDRGLAYLQLVLGISALTFVILVLFRLFTQVSFDQEPGGNYAYYFVSFTLSLIALAFSVAYVGSGVTAVILFKLSPFGSRYVPGLLKALLFNSIAVPCLFVQLVLSLIGLFYYVITSVMHNLDQRLKRNQLYACAVGFGVNLIYCGVVGGLSVRLIRRTFHLLCAADVGGYELRPLRPPADAGAYRRRQQQQQQLLLQPQPSPAHSSVVGGDYGGGPSNGDIVVLANFMDEVH